MSQAAWMMSILLTAHFLGDWLLQPREMALKKSTDFVWLLTHILITYLILAIGMSIGEHAGVIEIPKNGWWLLIVNAITHGIIDWNIWSGYKGRVSTICHDNPLSIKSFPYWDDKQFYNTIALDQFLHLVILVILFL